MQNNLGKKFVVLNFALSLTCQTNQKTRDMTDFTLNGKVVPRQSVGFLQSGVRHMGNDSITYALTEEAYKRLQPQYGGYYKPQRDSGSFFYISENWRGRDYHARVVKLSAKELMDAFFAKMEEIHKQGGQEWLNQNVMTWWPECQELGSDSAMAEYLMSRSYTFGIWDSTDNDREWCKDTKNVDGDMVVL
jgi:hypothetical protein